VDPLGSRKMADPSGAYVIALDATP
jgi:hypothetical protein